MRTEKATTAMTSAFITVATQTDGDVDDVIFDLSESSDDSPVSLTMSNLDLNSDESDNFTSRRKMMSSQTDLTLSDFDLDPVTSRDSDNFDKDFDDGLDDNFNPYEEVNPHSPEVSGCSDIRLPIIATRTTKSDKDSSESLLENGPDAARQCQQFFHLLRNQCNSQGNQCNSQGNQCNSQGNQCNSQGDQGCDELQEIQGLKTDVCCRFLPTQTGARISGRVVPKISGRMVPKMGTKVDFNRPLTSPSTARIPRPLPTTQNPLPPPHTGSAIRCVDKRPQCLKSHLVPCSMKRSPQWDTGRGNVARHKGVYHSDSERSSVPTPSPHHKLWEWNSDGDARNMSFPSSDDSTDQSPGTIHPSSNAPVEKMEKLDSLRHLYEQYADVMYTNQANLEHTIMIQQRLFEQQIANRNKAVDKKSSLRESPPVGNSPQPGSWLGGVGGEKPTPFEWVIRRRADGTRYITRRPVSTTTTRDRAKQSDDVRGLPATFDDHRKCVATTTDDDVGSEARAGRRCWSKEERKLQLERARSQRRAKEMKKTTTIVQEPLPSDIPMTQSRSKVKKQQRLRSHYQTFAFQELLIHGRAEVTGKVENPLLSVITV